MFRFGNFMVATLFDSAPKIWLVCSNNLNWHLLVAQTYAHQRASTSGIICRSWRHVELVSCCGGEPLWFAASNHGHRLSFQHLSETSAFNTVICLFSLARPSRCAKPFSWSWTWNDFFEGHFLWCILVTFLCMFWSLFHRLHVRCRLQHGKLFPSSEKWKRMCRFTSTHFGSYMLKELVSPNRRSHSLSVNSVCELVFFFEETPSIVPWTHMHRQQKRTHWNRFEKKNCAIPIARWTNRCLEYTRRAHFNEGSQYLTSIQVHSTDSFGNYTGSDRNKRKN